MREKDASAWRQNHVAQALLSQALSAMQVNQMRAKNLMLPLTCAGNPVSGIQKCDPDTVYPELDHETPNRNFQCSRLPAFHQNRRSVHVECVLPYTGQSAA